MDNRIGDAAKNVSRQLTIVQELESKFKMARETIVTKVQSVSSLMKNQDKLCKKNETAEKKKEWAETEIAQNNYRKERDIKRIIEEHEKYDKYLQGILSLQESKLENTTVNNQDDIDEDAYPILTRLKLEIKKERAALVDLERIKSGLDMQKQKLDDIKTKEINRRAKEEEEKIREDALKAAREKHEKEKREEEERYNKRKETKIQEQNKEEEVKTFATKLKEFKKKYKSILQDKKYKFFSNSINEEDNVFDYLNKDEYHNFIDLTSEDDIVKYLDSIFAYNYKRVMFNDALDCDTSNKLFTELEKNIYYNLDKLIHTKDGYNMFFDLDSVIKQKKFLKKYEKEYSHKLKEDE